jgi:hypothetical protein
LFEGCTSIKSIIIPEGVEKVGYYSFSGCTNLETVTIPSSVILIDENAFYNCPNIQTVTIDRNPALEVLSGNGSLGLE